MKIQFRGVRGSIATPRQDTIKYGGNTTCIEVITDEGNRIIIDAGTGIYPLGQELLAELPVDCLVFLTHTHWDHIQGLPFFVPLFIPGNNIHIYGAFDPVYQKSIKDILKTQMEYCYFPIREGELKASIEYTSLRENQVIEVGSTKVTSVLMNHTVLNYGYKIECGDKKVFFSGDHEPLYNIYDPEDDFFEEYNELIQQKEQIIIDFIDKADVAILDTSYTEEEYQKAKKGWGHGTFNSSLNMAKQANVDTLYFTHHEPVRTDDELDTIYNKILDNNKSNSNDQKCFMAKEGFVIEL